MLIHTFHTGGDRNLAYLIADDATNKAVVIDPSYSPKTIADLAAQNGYDIVYVFNTHGHDDHTNGNDAFAAATGLRPLRFGERDERTAQDVVHNATFPLGRLFVRIIHTPGHTWDSICFLVDGALFTGDTLFIGKVGGTDLQDGARQQYISLHERLLTLPGNTRVYPGHDVGVSSESTIRHESEVNPFLLMPDLESFINLKATWSEYKKEHGIA